MNSVIIVLIFRFAVSGW